MFLDYDPGDKVINPLKKEWGIGQVQSIIDDKVTVELAGTKKDDKTNRNGEFKLNNVLEGEYTLQVLSLIHI